MVEVLVPGCGGDVWKLRGIPILQFFFGFGLLHVYFEKTKKKYIQPKVFLLEALKRGEEIKMKIKPS